MLRTLTVLLNCAQPCRTTVEPAWMTTSVVAVVVPNRASQRVMPDVSCRQRLAATGVMSDLLAEVALIYWVDLPGSQGSGRLILTLNMTPELRTCSRAAHI